MEKYIEFFGKNHPFVLQYKELLDSNQIEEAEKQRKFLDICITAAKIGIYHINKID